MNHSNIYHRPEYEESYYMPYLVELLKQVKDVSHIRVCYDAHGGPFSFHAMSDNRNEVGYIIPSAFKGLFTIAVREWGIGALNCSGRIELDAIRKWESARVSRYE